jgi:hypothetical protein
MNGLADVVEKISTGYADAVKQASDGVIDAVNSMNELVPEFVWNLPVPGKSLFASIIQANFDVAERLLDAQKASFLRFVEPEAESQAA